LRLSASIVPSVTMTSLPQEEKEEVAKL